LKLERELALMSGSALHSTNAIFARYRGYLKLAAAISVDPRLRDKFDASDIVQETLFEAVRDWDRHSGSSEEERLAWLRRMLANNLLDAVRRFRAEKRDIGRERSLEESVQATMCRLGDMLAGDTSTPSCRAMREERDLQIADAVAALPDAQREAVILQRWHGWSLSEIGDHLGKTPEAVAGLIFRAQRELHRSLAELAP
jgi:RNA polymerase sigma-70 factor, ECF subfamily